LDISLHTELEELFRTNFLKSAPLYQASSVFRLPYEDIKKITTAYRGSLTEVTRPVEEISDYEIAKDGFTGHWVIDAISKLARDAGACVDGLIRLENTRNHPAHDSRNTADMRVTDIFDHADGHKNLQITMVSSAALGTEFTPVPGWVAYRFYFAAATISSQYRKVSSV